MFKLIRRQLLRVPRINRAVTDYRRRQEEKRYHERWAMLMRINGMIK